MEETFKLMSDEELRKAFEEFRNHERNQILEDGIITNIVNGIASNNSYVNSTLLIIQVEMGLLREMAIRFYDQP
jgi:hypothetical protein